MTYAPATIKAAAAIWVAHGGTNAGIVGSIVTHCKGYHLGHDRIYSQCACRPSGSCRPGLYGGDYSMQLYRDRIGATDAAMAFDIGPLDGSTAKLQRFSRWLVEQCQSNTSDTQDIREVIYAPYGTTVYNWLRDRGTDSEPEVGGDSTHRHHTHVSYYRDTELRDKTALFKRYFGMLPKPPTPPAEDEDLDPRTQRPVALAAVAAGGTLYAKEDRSVVVAHNWPGGADIQLYAKPAKATLPDGRSSLAPVLIDTASGPAEELHIYWVGWDLVSNVREVPGLP